MSKSDTTKHRNFVYHDPVLQNYLSRNTHGSLLHESPKLGKDPVNTHPYHDGVKTGKLNSVEQQRARKT